ncbi:hypothetical protein CKO11_15240 [Rhodobacter sp. TJ_12]|uniref:nitrilase-related carbon-nitrogen hydrolase n=1 Tax=Rhodobacter sp. TJ_12 TaxID=2029399 RepID=UPI001CC125E0|nr:nitrilase-related carbon-nitrogen hydrolase [Rhodobacter sp. TJ_12]MBZ4023806.1 hypothetical protein [Rhodobacter sp. TJ_12]
MKPLGLALWQAESVAGDTAAAFAQIATGARAAGAAGATVITFPELFVTGYDRDDLPSLALSQDQIAARLAPLAQAAGCAICTGYPERLETGTVANAAICVSATGAVLANHRKLQLYGAGEAARFVPGTAYTTFDLAGHKAALLICYDVEFPQHIAALQAQGVTLILAPTAAMHPFAHVGAHVVPAMAAIHAMTIVYANFCGQENALHYFGGSVIACADGSIAAQAGPSPSLLLARVPMRYDAGLLSTQAQDYRRIT